MPMKSETRFRTYKVIPFLKTLMCTTFFPIQQKSFKGHPDFMLCINGKFVALELKADDGVISLLQEETLKAVSRTGGISIVAYPMNWHLVKEKLTRLDGGIDDY